jgi:signal transduction histidine kinase
MTDNAQAKTQARAQARGTSPLAARRAGLFAWAGPCAEVLSGQTYRNTLYLWLGLPLGIVYFVIVLVGLALGAGLTVTLIGVPILAGTAAAVAGFAWLERGLAGQLVGLEMPRTAETLPQGQGVFAWARAYVTRAVFWKTLAYLLLKLPFAVLAFAVTLVLWALGLGLLLAPVGTLFSWPPSINLEAFSYTFGLPQLFALSAVGLGFCMIAARLSNLLALGNAAVARFMLTDNLEEAETQRLRVEALTLASNAASLASGLAVQNTLGSTLENVMKSVRNAIDASACGLVLDGTGLNHAGKRIAAAHGFGVGKLEGLIEAGVLNGNAQNWISSSLGTRSTLARPARPEAGGWGSLVIVPLEIGSEQSESKRKLGHLLVAYPPRQTPMRAELGFLSAIADQLSVGLENARLISIAQDRAALEERHRLARELHDSVSQALFGIALGARTAKAQLSRDPSKVAEPLDYVLQLAEAGLSEMRALIFELRPEALETEGLVVALRKQAEAMRVRYKLEVETQLDTEPDVPLEVKQSLLRIAQEALHNTVKHARATHATLALRVSDTITLEMRDDGQGFDPASLPTSGSGVGGRLGQRSMRERAEAIGARFELHTSPGHGTRIRVTLPVSATS